MNAEPNFRTIEPMAEESLDPRRAKLDFLASLNHEMRTPLNGILGHADLLLGDRHLTPHQRRHAESIRAAGSALLAVANQILNFALADADDAVLEGAPFAVAEVVNAAVAGVMHLAERKGLAIDAEVEPSLPGTLVGDRDRLRQVLVSVVDNAVRYTPRGAVRVSVAAAGERSGSSLVRFSVSDTGTGMSPELLSSVLEGAGPAAEGTCGLPGSAGLALQVARRLVEAMGGTFGIDSVPHFGTTVSFTIPLQAARQRPGSLRSAARGRRTARVLLVEDDEINREIARSTLEAAGHEVDVACDGSVALLMVQSNVYHVVLMDVQMPVMDGISATRLIRSLPGPECDVPIVAVTANVLPDQVRAFRAAGVNDHVAKPFRRDELLSLVDRWAFDAINAVIGSLAAPALRA